MKRIFTLKLRYNISKNILLIVILFISMLKVNAQGSLTTTYILGSGLQLPTAGSGITFVVQNTNSTSRVLTQIDQTWDPAFTSSPVAVKLWMSTTSLSGLGTGVTAPVWTLMATNSNLVISALGTIPTFTGLSIVIPAGAQYRFAIESSNGVIYGGATSTPNNFTADGVVLKVGDAQVAGANVGYALNPPPTLLNNPRFFGGKITWALETACVGGAFNPGNTISSSASVCPTIPFNLSVQNSPLAGTTGISYQWQSSINGTTYTNIAGATSINYSPAQSVSTYYRLIATCSGTAVNSTPVQVTMAASTACYCIPTVINCGADDNISSVVFAGINNTQATPCLNTNGYTNYTSLASANVLQTANYPISVTVGPGGTEYVGVWIDYNQNGTFDASEFTAIGSANGTTISSSITIPATATVGITRMRIRVQYNNPVAATDACSQTSGFGEVEDYKVTISAPPPCTGTPAPGNTLSNATNICNGIPFNLRIQNIVIVTGLSYQWQTSPNGNAPWTNVGPNLPAYSGVTQTATTYYRCNVTCGTNTASSTPVLVTQNATNQCYCASAPSSNADEDIFNVTVGTLNNSSTCDTLSSGFGSIKNLYSNYANTATGAVSALATNVVSGGANPFSVAVGTCGGNFTNSVAIWIDYNQDGVFSVAERAYTSLSGTPGPHVETGILNIPATALPGTTRMRVICSETGISTTIPACGPYGTFASWGETEDYIVNIIPCVPVVITAPLANVTASCGSIASIVVPVIGSIPSFQWQVRTSATGAWGPVVNNATYSGATTGTLSIATGPVLDGYQYRAFVTGACSAVDVTSVSTLTITTLPLSIAPATITKCLSAAPVLITAPSTQSVLSFTNSTPGIADNGVFAGITRDVTVSGVTGPIQKVRVKINALSTYVGDLIISLKAPNGRIINLDYLLNLTNNGPSGTNPNPPGPGPNDGFINTIFNLNRVMRGTPSASGVVSPLAQGIDQFNSPYTAEFPIDNQQAVAFTSGGVPLISGPTGYAANTNNVGTFYAHTPVSSANGVWTLGMYDAGPPDSALFKNFTLEITYGGVPATMVFTPTTGLFTDAAGTIPYTGTAVTQVYAAPTSNTTYGAVISAGPCSTASQAIVVNVNTLVATTPLGSIITLRDTAICANQNASFSLIGTLTGGPGFTHNYQVSIDNGVTFTNIVNGGSYSGANTATLTITGAPIAFNGYRYRDSINTVGGCGFIKSAVGRLTVNTTPVVTISAAPITKLFPGLTSTLTAAVSSATAPLKYQWLRDGVAVAGATNNTRVVTVDALGAYTINVIDANGCTSAGITTPASISVLDSVNKDKLFIYPSPNTGQFQVRFFNDLNDGARAPGFINVYDAKGARVFSKAYSIGAGYQPMIVDLGVHAKGIYRVDLTTLGGERIKTGSVMVF
jgi:subtilisin-like proprotein convertase family protein